MPGFCRSLSAAARAFADPYETQDLESRAHRAESSASRATTSAHHAMSAYHAEHARRVHTQRATAQAGYRIGYREGTLDTRDRARWQGYRRGCGDGYHARAVEDRRRVRNGEILLFFPSYSYLGGYDRFG